MHRCVFIGDAVSAAGLRLAGVYCLTPAPTPDAVLAAFTRHRPAKAAERAAERAVELAANPAGTQASDRVRDPDGAGLIIVTAQLAALLPAPVLAAALREQAPPVVVVADLRGEQPATDRAAALRRQLGMAE